MAANTKDVKKEVKKENENLRIWNIVGPVPEEARKIIEGGRLAGLTNINPMHRIKAMTEAFGVYGEGWYVNVLGVDTQTFENGLALVKATVEVTTAIGKDDDGTIRYGMPSYGIGTAWLISKEKGQYFFYDDNAYKKALTDALGYALKNYGVGAEVYYAEGVEGENKYDKPLEAQTMDKTHEAKAEPKPKAEPKVSAEPIEPMLDDDEIITPNQANHLIEVASSRGRRSSNMLSFINNSEAREKAKAEAITDLTYGEYCKLLSFLKVQK